MVPASNHSVVVSDSSSGVVVADAIRFVSAGVGGGTGLYYMHSDHLGTPQKMTDGNQALVWDAVYKPFGEAQSITGTASNNQRFPGQYADGETGFHQNYFRDYDPSVGRYMERDPIGLGGGMHTYGYVGGNPHRWTDRWGLLTEIIIWAPVGWGQSSFGHVSTNIDGTTYSFGPDGLTIEPTTDYLARNNFRNGVGEVLDLSPAQQKAFEKCLKENKEKYNSLTNNCQDPPENCLRNLGIDLGSDLLPVSFGESLLDLGIVDYVNFYEPTNPAAGWNAPWAK